MAENSKIEWTTHTWNAWRGCTKVSDGCKHCYAESQSKRNPLVLGEWGPNGTRVLAVEKTLLEPYHWDDRCRRAKIREQVFSLSLGDWLEDWPGQMKNHKDEPIYYSPSDRNFDPWTTDRIVPDDHFEPYTLDVARVKLLRAVFECQHLDFLLLTKRPENWAAKIRAAMDLVKATPDGRKTPFYSWLNEWLHGREAPKNVRIGTSVENQPTAESRIPHLLRVPAKVRFLSMEPLLGPVDLTALWLKDRSGFWNALTGHLTCKATSTILGSPDFWVATESPLLPPVNWVIVGGESGHGARPMHPAWVRSIRDQCQAAGVPFFMKQMDKKEPIPADLFIREFPSGN
jgi:protein gp37